MPVTWYGKAPKSQMPPLALLVPSPSLQGSYRGLVDEFTERGENLVPFTLSFSNANFPEFLRKLEDCTKGIGVPSGFVSHSTFWLVRDRIEVIGVANIRHKLTDALRREGGHIGYGVRPSARRLGYAKAILKMSIERGLALGLSKVLVTCAKSNIPSVKTILHNGGVLDSEEFLPDRGEIVQRYWIANRATVGALPVSQRGPAGQVR